MLTVRSLSKNGYGLIPIVSASVPNNAGRFVSVSCCIPAIDYAGSSVIAEVQGYSENGPISRTGDRPFKHVELYGELYPQQYQTGEYHPSSGWDPGYYYSGPIYTLGGRSWRNQNYCVFQGRVTLPNGDIYEVISCSYDKSTERWTYQYHWWQAASEKWSQTYVNTRSKMNVYRLPEGPGQETMLPWQHRLWSGLFDIALDSCEYSGGWDQPPHWGDLCQEAVEGTRVINLNTMMYCKELLELGSMVRSTIETVKDLKRNPIQAASSLYLSYHYGYRLTVKDTAELYKAAKREFNSFRQLYAASRAKKDWSFTYPSWTTFAGSTCKRSRCVKVWYKQMDEGIRALLNGMFRWDVFPELGNVYDMIPYSFVVDWFLPFGDILDKIDYHTYSYTLPVVHTVRSDAYEVRIPVSSPFLLGVIRGYSAPQGLTLKVYHRWFESGLTYPPLQLEAQAGPKNWVPAGALILQRTK